MLHIKFGFAKLHTEAESWSISRKDFLKSDPPPRQKRSSVRHADFSDGVGLYQGPKTAMGLRATRPDSVEPAWMKPSPVRALWPMRLQLLLRKLLRRRVHPSTRLRYPETLTSFNHLRIISKLFPSLTLFIITYPICHGAHLRWNPLYKYPPYGGLCHACS